MLDTILLGPPTLQNDGNVDDSPTPTNPGLPTFPSFSYQRQTSSVPRDVCEKLGRKIRRAGLVRDHQIWTISQGIKVYADAFKGQDFVAWLMREQNLGREEALDKGQWMLEHRVVEPVKESGGTGTGIGASSSRSNSIFYSRSPATPTTASTEPPALFPGSMSRSFSTERYYKLVDDQNDQKLPLNASDECPIDQQTGMAPPVVNVREYNARLCECVDRIYATILSEDKRRIHLDLLDECDAFSGDYLALAQEAAHLDIAGASTAERLAVFINLHNMMLVHITYKYGLPGTIWQRRKYLYSIYYTIGGHLYSLQSIFNGILRGNRKGLGMLWEPFGEQDLRKGFMIKGGEPLVHFGLNNYTRSTPPLRTYSAENVYDELRSNALECLGTKEFMQVDMNQPGNKVLLAKLFKQYAEDFGPSQDDVLKWLVRLLDPATTERSQLAKLLYTRSYTLAYLAMDTDLNMSYGLPAPNDFSSSETGTNNGNGSANANGGGSGRRGDWSSNGGVTTVEIDDDFC